MACNCKRVEKLGESMPEIQQEESLASKFGYSCLKVFYSFIVIILAIIAVPLATATLIYKFIAQEKMELTMPQFLIKYLEKQ